MKPSLYVTPIIMVTALIYWAFTRTTDEQKLSPGVVSQGEHCGEEWHDHPTPTADLIFRLLEKRVTEAYDHVKGSAHELEVLRVNTRADPETAQRQETRALLERHLKNQHQYEDALSKYARFMRQQADTFNLSLNTVKRSLETNGRPNQTIRIEISNLETDYREALRLLDSLDLRVAQITDSRTYTADFLNRIYNHHP